MEANKNASRPAGPAFNSPVAAFLSPVYYILRSFDKVRKCSSLKLARVNLWISTGRRANVLVVGSDVSSGEHGRSLSVLPSDGSPQGVVPEAEEVRSAEGSDAGGGDGLRRLRPGDPRLQHD